MNGAVVGRKRHQKSIDSTRAPCRIQRASLLFSTQRKEHKIKFSGQETVRGAPGLPREGVEVKRLVPFLRTQETQLVVAGINVASNQKSRNFSRISLGDKRAVS